MRGAGYPKGRKGYVVDHIVPFECGSPDIPSNIQWQTVQEAKIRSGCQRLWRTPGDALILPDRETRIAKHGEPVEHDGQNVVLVQT